MARLEAARLRLTVADTGLGPGAGAAVAGGGVGLDNIRQRLRAIFANDARLIVSGNLPQGFVAVSDMPLHANVENINPAAHEPV